MAGAHLMRCQVRQSSNTQHATEQKAAVGGKDSSPRGWSEFHVGPQSKHFAPEDNKCRCSDLADAGAPDGSERPARVPPVARDLVQALGTRSCIDFLGEGERKNMSPTWLFGAGEALRTNLALAQTCRHAES